MDIQLKSIPAAALSSSRITPGPSEPRLESEEEIEDDAAAHEAEEQGFAQEEEFIDSGPSEPKLGSENGEEEDETDAATHQAAVPKEEPFVLEQEIIDAIERGEEATVKQWLEKKEVSDVNECKGGSHSNGHFYVANGTALHWAAYYAQLGIAKLLINKGADLHVRANGEETVLHWVCQGSKMNEKLLDLLLSTSAKTAGGQLVNMCDYNGWTPLHYACYARDKTLTDLLLKAGADTYARDDDYSTPMDLVGGDEEFLDLLDKEHLLPRMNEQLELGEHIIEAIKEEKKEVLQQWLNRESEEVNHYRGGFAAEGGFMLEGGTALHWAAYYGKYHATKLLIDEGADPRALNHAKESTLHWACQSEKENEEVVELLLPKLKKKPIDVNFADEGGYTALHYACLRGYQDIVKKLLQAKADVSARNHFGETPLDSAFRSGKKQMIELMDKDGLLPRADDPKLKDDIVKAIENEDTTTVQKWLQEEKQHVNHCRGGNPEGTALHWAALCGTTQIATLLLSEGAKPHVMDKMGETVLHWACQSKQDNHQMVHLLLERMPAEDAERRVNSTNSKGCTALHYACLEGHQKVVEKLKDAKADPSAKSSAGYTPLDIAFVVADDKGKDKGVVEMLDSDRQLLPRKEDSVLENDLIEVWKHQKELNPCMVFRLCYQCQLSRLLRDGDKGAIEKWVKRESQNINRLRGGYFWFRSFHTNGTALHWAAYYGQLDIVTLLMKSGAQPRARAGDNGTVLHWACTSEKENRELVKQLLQKIVEDLIQHDRGCVKHRIIKPEEAIKTKDQTSTEKKGQTPLRCASIEGHHDVVKLLVKKGAQVEQQDLKVAIEEGNQQVVSNLLQSPQWPTLLRQRWENTTPFRELIKKMPEIAKQVLDRCVISNPKTRDPKNEEFEVVFDYSFVEDHQDKHKRPSTEETKQSTEEAKDYPKDKKKAHQVRFDEVHDQEEKNFTTSYGPPFKKPNHPLAIMVQHERLDVLNHPVIRSLLHYKWFKYGLWGYLVNLLIYVIFLVFLTSFALVVLNPQSTTCMQVLSNPLIGACGQMEGINSTGEITAERSSGMMPNDTAGGGNETCIRCELSDARSRFVFTAAVIIIILAGVRLLLEASQLVYQLRSYFSDWVNWIEVSLYILAVIFVSVFRTTCLCPQVWQWQIGVMVILLAWIDLIIVCAKFPNIGIYVIMFGKVLGTFLKVLLLAILLVATFGLTFYMTFSEPQYQRSPFAPPETAMIKIMSMTAGDFSFDTVFRRSPSGETESAQEIQFPPISYILWIIFVILMPILFTNMLLGLAVGDIQQIQKEAELRKLALQVELILTTEDLLRSAGGHRRFITGKKSVFPNLKATAEDYLDKLEGYNIWTRLSHRFRVWKYFVFEELSYQLWGGQRYDTLEILQEALQSNLDSDSKDGVQKEDSNLEDQEKPKDEDERVKYNKATEGMEQMMFRMMEMMSECMRALEELKETNAPKHGLGDTKTESEADGDSEESEADGDSEESDSNN